MTDALRAAAQQALDALVHHTEQTRPINRTDDAVRPRTVSLDDMTFNVRAKLETTAPTQN